MGSFSTTCGLTGLAIEIGDRAGFLPLAATKYRYDDGGPIMTDPTVFCGPAGAPVFGRYDSYGRLADATRPHSDGELVADKEVFEGRGMFFHARALEAIIGRLDEDPFAGQRRNAVVKHWDELTAFMDAHPGNPLDQMYAQLRMRRGDAIGELMETLQRSTAWDPEDFDKLRELSREQVADMMAVVDAANFMGRVLGPSGYISEGEEICQVELVHQVAGELVQDHEARAGGVF